MSGGPSSLPNCGLKTSQSMIEDELMLFRLIDLQQPTNSGSGNPATSSGNPATPTMTASSFTAVFREPASASTVLNFGYGSMIAFVVSVHLKII